MMNMFIYACPEDAEVGFTVDVDKDDVDSVDEGSVCVWGGWWPEGWVCGWVDGVVDCRRLVCHNSQLALALVMQEV